MVIALINGIGKDIPIFCQRGQHTCKPIEELPMTVTVKFGKLKIPCRKKRGKKRKFERVQNR